MLIHFFNITVDDRQTAQPFFWLGGTDQLVKGVWIWYTNEVELETVHIKFTP